MSRDVMVVRALASHQSSPGLNPGCGVILEVEPVRGVEPVREVCYCRVLLIDD